MDPNYLNAIRADSLHRNRRIGPAAPARILRRGWLDARPGHSVGKSPGTGGVENCNNQPRFVVEPSNLAAANAIRGIDAHEALPKAVAQPNLLLRAIIPGRR